MPFRFSFGIFCSSDSLPSDFRQAVFEMDDSNSIMPLKDMEYPYSLSVERAWDGVARHLYDAMRQLGEEARGKTE